MLILQMNPLDLPGPKFLLLYVFLIIIAMIAVWLIKRALLNPPWSDTHHITVDPYEAAYLRGGAVQAIDTAIAMLAQRQVIEVSKTAHLIYTTKPLPAGTHWFEKAVHHALTPKPGRRINDIRSSALLTPHTDRLAAKLQEWGLLPSDNRWRVARVVSGLLMLAVVLFGVAKIFVGISRDRPVAILMFLCLIAGIILLAVINMRPARTRLGEQALKQFQGESAALQMAARTQPNLLAGGDVALAIGLFGIDALAFSDNSWADLKATLQLPPPASGGSSSSSGCGSSSCGGGCGGGGCGGCGG